MTSGRMRVLATAPIHELAERWLREHTELTYVPDLDDLRARRDERLADAEVLVVRSNITVDTSLLDRHPRLSLLIRAGAGMDNLDLDALAARNVRVERLGSQATALSVAELALGLAIGLVRRVPEATAGFRSGEWRKQESLGDEIAEMNVGVWGYGPIGTAVHELFVRAGARVAVQALDAPDTVDRRSVDELVDWARLHVLALPLDSQTRHIFGGPRLVQIAERHSYIVNVGRWDLVDVPAALEHLAAGKLPGLAIDPVERRHIDVCRGYEHLNLILTPHIGAMTRQAQERIARQMIGELTRLTGEADGG